jgi:hypothetical protein
MSQSRGVNTRRFAGRVLVEHEPTDDSEGQGGLSLGVNVVSG